MEPRGPGVCTRRAPDGLGGRCKAALGREAYDALTEDRPGMFGAVTARAEVFRPTAPPGYRPVCRGTRSPGPAPNPERTERGNHEGVRHVPYQRRRAVWLSERAASFVYFPSGARAPGDGLKATQMDRSLGRVAARNGRTPRTVRLWPPSRLAGMRPVRCVRSYRSGSDFADDPVPKQCLPACHSSSCSAGIVPM